MSDTVAVLGGGSFGTVLAHLAAFNCDQVILWARDDERVKDMRCNRQNSQYLPGFEIHPKVHFTSDIDEALADANTVLIAVPSSSFRKVTIEARQWIKPDTIVMSGTKGVEPGTFKLMSEILDEELPNNPNAVISGPNLAVEIMERKFTGTVISTASAERALALRQTFISPTFIPYYNSDMLGVQIAGALKNIYALMAGYMQSKDVGFNANSTLMTRALAEMMRFGIALGANPTTFLGIAGVGDLIATCTSPLSRNYQLGARVGSGASVEDALQEMGQAVEGVNTLTMVHKKKQELTVHMPLVDGIWEIWHGKKSLIRLMAEWKGSDLPVDIAYSSE